MGYTHYWERPIELDQNKYSLFSKDVRKIFEASREKGIWLSDGLDKKPEPLADDENIWFNGRGDNSHETFHLPRIFTPQEWMKPSKTGLYFGFCKTSRKPYDLTVMAVLVSFKHSFNEVKVTSDGIIENWAPAKGLCNQLFGYGIDFKLNRELAINFEETYGLKVIKINDIPKAEDLKNV